ncbi:ankyrin repeat domain protein [Nitzschia inconspicua]|uniref:Ankyrin repeat domain protein n=1 Tax=Nitzschia inconspicua TaxID=303405 RepID=A0A9K3PZY3_9STRA|nr:ankyrin repeat domain protein [Nitzschia inconspicua]
MEITEDNGDTVRLNSFISLDKTRPFWQRSAASSSRRRSTPPVSTKSPGRLPVKPSKRKPENPFYEPAYVESCLVQLCRAGKWEDVLQRCQEHPEEANLVPLFGVKEKNAGMHDPVEERFHRHPLHRRSKSSGQGLENTELFRETPLGIVCASEDIGKSYVPRVIKALIEANPRQVGASQLLPGHTALRDACLNHFCPVEILEILLEACSMYSNNDQAFRLRDQGGVSCLEHLIAAVQLGLSSEPLEKVKVYIKMRPIEHRKSADDNSPLIFLLTTGNSFNDGDVSFATQSSLPQLNGRLERVFELTKLLLDDDPGLLSSCSKVSGCSPMHAALRNYGTFEPLIQELINRGTRHQLMDCRNMYGDLPLHVACSVGVPMKVLLLVLGETAKISLHMRYAGMPPTVNPLIWSTNNSGYTPIDLEWVRVIESGSDFLSARTFYPLEATGVRRHCFKQDDYYKDLLRKAVNQVMQNSAHRIGSEAREEDARSIFGSSIDRISLLIKAASYFGDSGAYPDTSVPVSLADVCKLCRVYTPSLPLPLLDLFLWLRSEDILETDSSGNIPLHHVLSGNNVPRGCSIVRNSNLMMDWQAFVVRLIDKYPAQAKVRSGSERLPLHLILDRSVDFSGELAVGRHKIVERLVEIFPDSVELLDPVTGLYPFMMAANDPNLSIDTVFLLLRHAPSQCLPNKT